MLSSCKPTDATPDPPEIELHSFAIASKDRGNLDAPETLATSIERASEYLVVNAQADGRFAYLRDSADRHGQRGTQYNLLRHAGAVYALCQRHAWQPDERIAEVAVRAVDYLNQNTVEPVPEFPDVLAIWTTRELTGEDVNRHAKLGGTGLGLVAMLSVEAIQPGTTSEERLRRLGRFLRMMQRPDGSFYSRFVPQAGGFDTNWVSLYYPGEAALALIQLYRWDGNREWYDAALGGLLYLADVRDGQLDVPADHWALLATEQLLLIEQPIPLETDRRKLLRHARQICRVMLNQQQLDPRQPELLGCFTPDGRTTPTSTRVEGLAAALTFLPSDQPALRQEIESACQRAVRFLAAAQIPSGDLRGGMPKSIGRFKSPLTTAAKRLNQSADEVRVDYVQHALSAWLQWIQRQHRPLQPHRPIEAKRS